MKILVQLMDDAGEVVARHEADASSPSQWRAQPGQRFVSKMPQQSDNQNTGTYELHGFTFQPHLRVDRPNGYTSPIPTAPIGLPANFPQQVKQPAFSYPGKYTTPMDPKLPYPSTQMWSPSAPTPAPQTNIEQGPAPAQRI